MEEYKKWLAEQKSEYSTLFEAPPASNGTDSVKLVTQVLPQKK